VEDKTKITLTERAVEELTTMPEDFKQNVKTIIEYHGDLNNKAFLEVMAGKFHQRQK